MPSGRCGEAGLLQGVRCRCVLVGVWPCRGPIAGAAARPRRGDHLCRSLAVKACAVAFRNKLRKGKLPGLLPMVGEPAALLRVQPQRTRHLERQIAQVKPLVDFRPGVETGSGLLHNVSFCGQPAAWTGPQRSR